MADAAVWQAAIVTWPDEIDAGPRCHDQGALTPPLPRRGVPSADSAVPVPTRMSPGLTPAGLAISSRTTGFEVGSRKTKLARSGSVASLQRPNNKPALS